MAARTAVLGVGLRVDAHAAAAGRREAGAPARAQIRGGTRIRAFHVTAERRRLVADRRTGTAMGGRRKVHLASLMFVRRTVFAPRQTRGRRAARARRAENARRVDAGERRAVVRTCTAMARIVAQVDTDVSAANLIEGTLSGVLLYHLNVDGRSDVERHSMIDWRWPIDHRADVKHRDIHPWITPRVERPRNIVRRCACGWRGAAPHEEGEGDNGTDGMDESHRSLLGLNLRGCPPALSPFWNRKNAGLMGAAFS